MCGRVNVSDNEGVRALLESLGMDTWPSRDPRWNIAQTQTLDVVKLDDDLELVPMSWGFTLTMPGKSSDKLVTKRIQNSRSDKVWSSRMWKKSIEERRVLVPINGFYEWKRKNKKLVSAYYITPAGKAAMFLAGIYRDAKGEDKPEVSVVTTEANDAMSKVHDRMPLILNSSNVAMAWLNDDSRDTLDELMQPAANNALKFTRVSDYVNKSSNEGPECIEPADDQAA